MLWVVHVILENGSHNKILVPLPWVDSVNQCLYWSPKGKPLGHYISMWSDPELGWKCLDIVETLLESGTRTVADQMISMPTTVADQMISMPTTEEEGDEDEVAKHKRSSPRLIPPPASPPACSSKKKEEKTCNTTESQYVTLMHFQALKDNQIMIMSNWKRLLPY